MRGIDRYLLIFNVSTVTRNGDVSVQGQSAKVDGYDADLLLTPLPAVLGRKQLVEGINGTEGSVGRTNKVLVGTARELITREL